MTDHRCLGLRACVDHPKWMVSYGYGLWFAYAPYTFTLAGYFSTWREAYNFAYARATEATP